MPFVEAPSIMNEMLLARHILARAADPRMRRWVIMQVLGTYHHNFVTHLLEAELQRRVYRLAEGGQPVTAPLLNESKRDILAGFWGDTVEIDDGARMTWMRQPHYYMGLYPYTYSVGLVAATALAEKSNREGPAVLSALARRAARRRHAAAARADAPGRHRPVFAAADPGGGGLCGAADRGAGSRLLTVNG